SGRCRRYSCARIFSALARIRSGGCGMSGAEMPGVEPAAMPFPILVGDIGGTNARFSLLADAGSEPLEFANVRTADHANIDDAIASAIYPATTQRPRSAVLAVAGPVEGDEIE